MTFSVQSGKSYRWRVALDMLVMFGLLACDRAPTDASADTEDARFEASERGVDILENLPAAGFGTSSLRVRSIEAVLADKLDTYAACFDGLNKRVRDSLDEYIREVGSLDAGPRTDAPLYRGLLQGIYVSDRLIEKCRRQFAGMISEVPPIESLTVSSENYIAALVSLRDDSEQAHYYFEHELFKDDGFSQGRLLHAGVSKHARAYYDASDTFSAALESEMNKLAVSQLAAIEEVDGHNATYWRLLVMTQARQLIRVLSDEKFSVVEAEKRTQALESAIKSMALYVSGSDDGLFLSVWRPVLAASRNYLEAARARIGRMRVGEQDERGDQTRSNQGTEPWLQTGTEDQLSWAYEALLRSTEEM